ncbi:MAG: SPOR domain-containing protein, partial [Alistipes sp.]|nr:SPOR domain-containing protein [Alistipes sp.]
VMWSDGVYRNVSGDGEAAREVFRIEIASAAPLTAEVRQAIAGTAGEAAISRAGQKFVVGMFDDRAVAERVAAAVRQAAPGLEIKIEEITE